MYLIYIYILSKLEIHKFHYINYLSIVISRIIIYIVTVDYELLYYMWYEVYNTVQMTWLLFNSN